MFTHCYKTKTSDQFIQFIKRVDSRYDSSIKTIFVVLDNASIHRSKKTRNAITRYHPRIVPVFLPTRSRTEPDRGKMDVVSQTAVKRHLEMNIIGKAVSNWTVTTTSNMEIQLETVNKNYLLFITVNISSSSSTNAIA